MDAGSSISSKTPSSYARARALPSSIQLIRSLRYAGSSMFSMRSPRPSTTPPLLRGFRRGCVVSHSSLSDESSIQSPSSTPIGKCSPRTCHSVSINKPSTVPSVRSPRATLALCVCEWLLLPIVPRPPQPPPHMSPSQPPRTSRHSMSWIAYDLDRPPGPGRIRYRDVMRRMMVVRKGSKRRSEGW